MPLGYSRSFVLPLLYGLEHVSWLRYARPVDFLFRLRAVGARCAAAVPATTLKMLAYPLCFILFERAGVGLLLDHANSRQRVQDRPALHFQFAC
jgi:hypothetical protein